MVSFDLTEFEDFYVNHIYEEYGIVDIKCYGGSPIEINGYCFDLSMEVEQWLSENIKDYQYDETSGNLLFQVDDEAMMFKLVWL